MGRAREGKRGRHAAQGRSASATGRLRRAHCNLQALQHGMRGGGNPQERAARGSARARDSRGGEHGHAEAAQGVWDAGRRPPLWHGGHPFFGTCAGCIMTSKSVDVDEAMAQSIQPNQETLELADFSVCRNAYGAQVHSFEAELVGDTAVFGNTPCRAVLIRAPMITRAGAGTQTLLSHTHAQRGTTPVLLREKNALACTFHPEITGDARIHEYFLQMVAAYGKEYSLPK